MCIYIYPTPSLWTFRLLPCFGYCCHEHWGGCILLKHVFLWIYAQKWDCRVIWQFLRNLHTVPIVAITNLHSHQQCRRIPFSPHPIQHLFIYFRGFFDDSHLTSVRWYLIVVLICISIIISWGFSGGSVVKNPPANAGDAGLIPGLKRSPNVVNGNLLQYSCLEIPQTEESGGLQSIGLQRVRQDWACTQAGNN